jgi:MFS family permease
LVPLVVFGLYGGVLADRLNRRRLILSMEQVLMLMAGLLFVNALLGKPQVWVLYAVAFLAAAASSLQQPSLSALNQTLVPHNLQAAAAKLSNIQGTSAMIIGPALGGLVAVAIGPSFVYAANLVTFTFSLALLF